MHSVAGHKIHHYLITPHQALTASTVGVGVLAVIGCIIFSPFCAIALAASIGFGVYCYFKKDMDNPAIRKQEKANLANMPVIDLVKDSEAFSKLVDYDLGTSSDKTERERSYVRLNHLKTSYHEIFQKKEAYEASINATVESLSRDTRIEADRLKASPLKIINDHKAQEKTLLENLENTKELLKHKREEHFRQNEELKAKNPNIGLTIFSDAVHEREIASLESTLQSTRDLIRDHQKQRRKVQEDVGAIDSKLNEALAPLRTWAKVEKGNISTQFDQAQKTLTNLFKDSVKSSH